MPPRLRVVSQPKLRSIPSRRSKQPPLAPAAEWVEPKLLKPWPGNPRINDPVVDQIVESIKTFGFAAPIVARRATREIIAGHTRWKAAVKLGLEVVPVRYMDLDEHQAHLLCLADNRLGELADWDWPKVTKLLANTKIEDVKRAGFSDKHMEKIRALANEKVVIKQDDVPLPPTVAVTQPGDLWKLGNSRLVCGDSTQERIAKLAIGETQPLIMVTDPEYDMQYEADSKAADGAVAPWKTAYRLFPGPVAYVWTSSMRLPDVRLDLQHANFELRNLIVWRKPTFTLGRGHYHWQHETCWYAVRNNASARWVGDRSQSTVWDVSGMAAFGRSSDEVDASTGHSTQKPVELMARAIRNHGAAGDVVYEPFAGSGSTLIAAEQLERSCVAIELSPQYCDVIVDRWQKLTGGKARRVTS